MCAGRPRHGAVTGVTASRTYAGLHNPLCGRNAEQRRGSALQQEPEGRQSASELQVTYLVQMGNYAQTCDLVPTEISSGTCMGIMPTEVPEEIASVPFAPPFFASDEWCFF